VRSVLFEDAVTAAHGGGSCSMAKRSFEDELEDIRRFAVPKCNLGTRGQVQLGNEGICYVSDKMRLPNETKLRLLEARADCRLRRPWAHGPAR
jgi:hypothetical protein